MRLFGRLVTDLDASDMQRLLDDPAYESKTLEFKRELPGNSDADKSEFLKDVTAMANTAGGVILYGVDEQREDQSRAGFAARVPGIPRADAIHAMERLAQILQSSAGPPITSQVRMAHVELPSGKVVLALGIAHSSSRPHRVQQNRKSFWRRNDVATYEPDVTELRAMFSEGASWEAECEAFVESRLRQLRSTPGMRSSYVAVHILPMGRLRARLDIPSFYERAVRELRPLSGGGGSPRYNADGYVLTSYVPSHPSLVASHVQLFRFGGVEGVAPRLCGTDPQLPSPS